MASKFRGRYKFRITKEFLNASDYMFWRGQTEKALSKLLTSLRGMDDSLTPLLGKKKAENYKEVLDRNILDFRAFQMLLALYPLVKIDET